MTPAVRLPAEATTGSASSSVIVAYPKPTDAPKEAGHMSAELLSGALLTCAELQVADLPPREALCGGWFRQGSLGFLYGPRGLGKTWFSSGLARALVEGGSFGPWKAPKSRRVLYVDGEMPLEEMRSRNVSLSRGDGELVFLSHEWLFHRTGKVLNLADRETQAALLKVCKERRFDVLFLDNLSCLFSGVAENDADAWEQVQPWLLQLRRERVAVVFVHHTNRSGQNMRGTSKREDAAFWCIRLDETRDPATDGEGARFISRFSKRREGTREETEAIQWYFEPHNGKTHVTFKALPNMEVFRDLVASGLTSCGDIAEEMGMSKAGVCKLAKKAVEAGWLKIDGRCYNLVG